MRSFTLLKAIAYLSPTTIRTPADIGVVIKDSRLALGLDQAGPADRAGVSRLWINQVERGKPVPAWAGYRGR